MSEGESNPPPLPPPVSTFAGPVAELIAQQMLAPPARPGVLAALDHYEILRYWAAAAWGLSCWRAIPKRAATWR